MPLSIFKWEKILGLRNIFFCPKNAFTLFHIAMNYTHYIISRWVGVEGCFFWFSMSTLQPCSYVSIHTKLYLFYISRWVGVEGCFFWFSISTLLLCIYATILYLVYISRWVGVEGCFFWFSISTLLLCIYGWIIIPDNRNLCISIIYVKIFFLWCFKSTFQLCFVLKLVYIF